MLFKVIAAAINADTGELLMIPADNQNDLKDASKRKSERRQMGLKQVASLLIPSVNAPAGILSPFLLIAIAMTEFNWLHYHWRTFKARYYDKATAGSVVNDDTECRR